MYVRVILLILLAVLIYYGLPEIIPGELLETLRRMPQDEKVALAIAGVVFTAIFGILASSKK